MPTSDVFGVNCSQKEAYHTKKGIKFEFNTGVNCSQKEAYHTKRDDGEIEMDGVNCSQKEAYHTGINITVISEEVLIALKKKPITP